MAEKQPLCLGLLAHVDAGKTTVSEALLYVSGARRVLGRVDHADAYLDTHQLERARGITIFSKQALFSTEHRAVTLVDTPGHVDFSAEAERVLPVLDCAVLVISATAGIQSHTVTLWKLLERYGIPVVVFVNKTDLPGLSRRELLDRLQKELSPQCVDFDGDIAEAAAMCDEALLENYLATGVVTDGNIRELVAERRLFPCCFGSGLKLQGIDRLLDTLDLYAPRPTYSEAFGARVYKISRDPQGSRLTWLKVTGGELKVRTPLSYQNSKGETLEEKPVQLRLYSADKFTAPEAVGPGQLCAVTGLSATCVGQGLGSEENSCTPILEPVMTYRVQLPAGSDPMAVLPRLRQLAEEDPQLHLIWDDRHKQFHVQLMGKVQLEILRSVIAQRFGLEVTFGDRRIYYKETIADTVEGVGHFEPLRHYAEVHLLLEPLPAGSGLVFDTQCPTDVLDIGYQHLILTHLAEKPHLGILTGSPITDVKISLLVGKAHLKHTEGGDMRQATYRAVRQGLMQAKPVLLEPWYDFVLTVPTQQLGRAISDIRAMGGAFDAPEAHDSQSILAGQLPAGELGDYADQLAAYTQGTGQLQVTLRGYAPCHNTDKVVAELGYDPERDLENTPDSVFCAHGAGFTVKWDKVSEYMHIDSGLQKKAAPALIPRQHIDDQELEAIMDREFGPIKRPQYYAPATHSVKEEVVIRTPRETALIVDGYNVLFAWESLAKLADGDLEAARRQLCDILASYAGYKKCRVVLVFDGYRVKGNPGEKELLHKTLQVVYTKEGQTADAYIEALAGQIGKNYNIRVATSDSLVQLSSLGSGVLRMSARELLEEIEATKAEMRQHY